MITDTNSEIASLKNQVFTLLVALIVVSGTVTIYLYRQASLASKDIAVNQQLVVALNQKDAALNAFAGQLVGYAEKHPDFMTVLKKYNLNQAPAAPVAPKK